jgi:hypothetical protein
MAKRFVCKACGKGCRTDIKHTCDQTCRDCKARLPCVQAGVRIPCMDCNHFRSQSCFAKHNLKQGYKKSVCERKRSCDEFIEPSRKHECCKHYCETCKARKERGHFCYFLPLKNVLPSGDRVLYVFYDLKLRILRDTLILQDCISIILSVNSSFVLVVRALTIPMRTVHSAERGKIRSWRIQ